MPVLPARLAFRMSLEVVGIVDSAATVNVLPYAVGIDLGAVWEEQSVRIPLGGVLAGLEARALLVYTSIGSFSPIRLAFAWVQSDTVPLLFGQVNFFQEFDVCLFRTSGWIEVGPKRRRQSRPAP